MSISDEVKRLHELHQAGALSDAEFEQAKARLFANPSPTGDGGSATGSTLRRSLNDRWLGGVCGGLGKTTGIESWIWRLLFALVMLAGGMGILLYILMWIFVPEEQN